MNHAQCNLSKCTAKVVSLEPSRTYVYKEGLIQDGATLNLESSNLIAEKAKLC